MRYAIAVVDDAERDRESIRALARTWASSSGHGAGVRGFPSAESFLFYGGAYDILLLDVEMEGASGLDLARQLREAANRAEIRLHHLPLRVHRRKALTGQDHKVPVWVSEDSVPGTKEE